jgi:hypothetical protein
MMWVLRSALAVAVFMPLAAAGQQAPPPQQQPTQQQVPQQSNEWANLPRMQLERQFAGPLQDTIVQRWRDPVEGVICYIYLPITAAHSPPTPAGYVQYGANGIGSISCIEPVKPPAPSSARQPGH